MKNWRRGAALIMVLMLCSILLVAAIGFLSFRSGQYQASQSQLLATQAFLLAESGLNDAKQKMFTDVDFPPLDAGNSGLFSYAETLAPGHSYTVTIDKRLNSAPWAIWTVHSTGTVLQGNRVVSKRTLSFEIDVSPLLRDTTKTPNANLFKVYQIYDWGNQ